MDAVAVERAHDARRGVQQGTESFVAPGLRGWAYTPAV
jgi:hypothetical protein